LSFRRARATGPFALLGGVTRLRTAGLFLIAGSAVTLGLHFLGVPEDIYRWLYHHLLSGLDVPTEPSHGTVEAVRDVSLFGGILELVLGLVLLISSRRESPPM
jgi:hypothetical protein